MLPAATLPGLLVLQDFASLKNQIIDSERNGYGTELSDILHTITAQTAIDAAQLLDRFWDMFIVDADWELGPAQRELGLPLRCRSATP